MGPAVTIIGSLRDAVTAAGGTPASYNKVALLRQLVTALGGTPTKRDVIGLLRQAVTAAGGTPTKYAEVYVLRELLVALGATAATFILYKLYQQLATAAAGGGGTLPAPVIAQTSSAGASPFTFLVNEDAAYFPGYYWNAQSADVSNFASTLSDVIQQIEPGDLSGTDDIVLTGFVTATSGAMCTRLRVGIEDGLGGYTWGSWSNTLSDTIVAQAAAFTFTDVTNATQSTVYTSNTITISGLGGASNAYSVSGGTVSKNGGAYSGSSGTVVDGDTLAVRVTSSAGLSTAVNCTLTVGTLSDTYTVTTVASAAFATYRNSAAGNNGYSANFTFSSVTYYAAKNVIAIMGYHGGAVSAVSLGGTAGTKVAEVVTGAKTISFWEVVKGSGGSGNLAVTAGSVNSIGYALWTVDSAATFVAAQSLAYDYNADPNRTASVTMPSGGAILVACSSETAGASVVPESGTTEDAEFVDGSTWKYWVGERATTGVPGVTGLNFAGSQMLAVSYQP
jgi:hypothetical protein